MKTFGQIIKERRLSLGLLLRQVASYLDIDQAILSKIEHNERRPTKENILRLAEILKFDQKDLLIEFMSEKIAYEIVEEECAKKVLELAEQKVNYIRLNSFRD